MDGDNYIEFGWGTEVNPLLTHNASSLTLCLLSTTKNLGAAGVLNKIE